MGTQAKPPLLCMPSSLRLSGPLASCYRCWATLGSPSPCLLAGPQARGRGWPPAPGDRADMPGVAGGCARPCSLSGGRPPLPTDLDPQQTGRGAGVNKQEVGTPDCCFPDQGAPAGAHERPPAPIGPGVAGAASGEKRRPWSRGARVRVLLPPAPGCAPRASASPSARRAAGLGNCPHRPTPGFRGRPLARQLHFRLSPCAPFQRQLEG